MELNKILERDLKLACLIPTHCTGKASGSYCTAPINKCVSAYYFSCPHVKPIHLYTEEQASETSFYRFNQQNFTDVKEVKEC